MRDKRTVEELSVEELERILAVRRRQERQGKLERMRRSGRTVETQTNGGKQHPPESAILAAATVPGQPALKPDSSENGGLPRFVDGAEGAAAADPERDRFWKSFVNQALLLVEVAAVLGLVYIGYMLVQSIGELERETAEAQRMAQEQRAAVLPTIAPTPVLRIEDVVLPGGHTPPTSPHGAQPNLNEIPANLQPLVQAQLFQPVLSRPAPTDDTALRLIIPRLNIDQTIVQGTDWEALKQGVGQLLNGVTPASQRGNLVLSAHNDIYGELFRHLDQLEPGDRFQVQTRSQIYNYVVRGSQIVEPTDVHVLESTSAPTATLISCYPYQVNNKRIVVFAERVDSI
jgi:sortase A